MALYTIDTHSLVWHFTRSPMLSQIAKQCFVEIESGYSSAYVPVIAMAEAYYIARKKKITFHYQTLLNQIIASPNYFLYPFDYEILAKLGELERLTELQDQVIVATALLTHSILITKDETITKSGLVRVI